MKIVLAEDQPLILESLKVLLNSQSDMEVVSAVTDGKKALQVIERYKPDIAVLDIRMPVMSGLEVACFIKDRKLHIPVLLITTFDESEAISRALKIGVEGFLLKDIAPEMFITSLRAVAGGLIVFHPAVISSLKFDVKTFRNSENYYGLTKKDKVIIKYIIRGLANKEIAELENCAEGTIKNRVSLILSKMNIKARTQIAVKALREDLL